MTKSSKNSDMNNDLIRENNRELIYHPFSQFLLYVIYNFIVLIIVNYDIVRVYHVRSFISGKDRLICTLNFNVSRLLSRINDNKVRKKREISDVSTAVEESKALAQKLSEKKITFDRKSTVGIK